MLPLMKWLQGTTMGLLNAQACEEGQFVFLGAKMWLQSPECTVEVNSLRASTSMWDSRDFICDIAHVSFYKPTRLYQKCTFLLLSLLHILILLTKNLMRCMLYVDVALL